MLSKMHKMMWPFVTMIALGAIAVSNISCGEKQSGTISKETKQMKPAARDARSRR